jgi:hypothetical protein
VLLSAVFGAFFGLVMSSAEMSPSTAILVGAGGLYGVALWAVNFVAVALGGSGSGQAGSPWTSSPPTPFYGTVLGDYMDRALDNARRARASGPRDRRDAA